MGICYIVGAVPVKPHINKKPEDIIIAADGGLDSLIAAKINPDVIIGDMDSVTGVCDSGNAEIIRYPVEKDDTDTALAIKLGRERGFRSFIIFGCIGGLLDHTLANTALLNGLASGGCTAVFVDGKWGIAGISDRTLHFSEKASGRISVLSMTDASENVTITGMKYVLENATVQASYPIGVSNQFIGAKAEVSVKSGTLCIFTTLNNFIDYSDLFDKDACKW